MNGACSIFGIPISRLGLDEAVAFCMRKAAAGAGGAIYFVNVHSVTDSRSQEALARAMRSATACFADGMPLVWLSRRRGEPIESRVCGPDFMVRLLGATKDGAHGFIGGSPGQSEKVASRLGLTRAFHHSPPVRPFTEAAVAEDLAAFEAVLQGAPWPPYVWVGLGAPKQELWIEVATRLKPQVLFFGVGAAFDFLSGTKARAPEWMQHAGLEWLHRMASEPKRLGGRYLRTNLRFLVGVLKGDS